jgi:hypothetical protein
MYERVPEFVPLNRTPPELGEEEVALSNRYVHAEAEKPVSPLSPFSPSVPLLFPKTELVVPSSDPKTIYITQEKFLT